MKRFLLDTNVLLGLAEEHLGRGASWMSLTWTIMA